MDRNHCAYKCIIVFTRCTSSEIQKNGQELATATRSLIFLHKFTTGCVERSLGAQRNTFLRVGHACLFQLLYR
jgi:hypothetical protein